MPGMSTELHLEADQPGDYNGRGANITGAGFAGMTFVVRATSSLANFNNWIRTAQRTRTPLNIATYNTLAEPSQNNPVAYYAPAQDGLYDYIVMKYMVPADGTNNVRTLPATNAGVATQ